MGMNFTQLLNKKSKRPCVIIGAGSSVKKYHAKIKAFIQQQNAFTIGINNVNHMFTPDYHLWTNTGRYNEFGKSINKRSTLILGSRMKPEARDQYGYQYFLLNYTDSVKEEIGFDGEMIRGFYRTAANLSIMVAKLLGSNLISIVGMDGYTLNWGKDQHCYGKGHTDSDDYEYCQRKDDLIYMCLKDIARKIDFKIITPTVYDNFYKGGIL